MYKALVRGRMPSFENWVVVFPYTRVVYNSPPTQQNSLEGGIMIMYMYNMHVADIIYTCIYMYMHKKRQKTENVHVYVYMFTICIKLHIAHKRHEK